jgi:hypothetical protein
MKFPQNQTILKLFRKTFFVLFGLFVFQTLVAGNTFADCPEKIGPSTARPFHMLVLGDSIMWGQGLKQEQKTWWRVKCWLQEKTGREVREHIEAHSGAVIATASTTVPLFASKDAEVNLQQPTVNEQLDHALEFYGADRSNVDLILLDGCINDVGVTNLLSAASSLDEIRDRVKTSCGVGMHDLLVRVTESFPNAHVLVTGYYRIVSAKTADNSFIRLLVKKITYKKPEGRRMTDKEIRERLIAISHEWYKQSTASLAEAVNRTNRTLAERSLPPRVQFVEMEFWPEHAFSAPETLLWNFIFGSTNLSGFRKLLVVLTFGTAAYKPNDDMRDARFKSCKETFKKPKGVDEDKDQKSSRKENYLICRYASLGHPNQMGALIYAEAIKGKLQWLLNKADWLEPARQVAPR